MNHTCSRQSDYAIIESATTNMFKKVRSEDHPKENAALPNCTKQEQYTENGSSPNVQILQTSIFLESITVKNRNGVIVKFAAQKRQFNRKLIGFEARIQIVGKTYRK